MAILTARTNRTLRDNNFPVEDELRLAENMIAAVQESALAVDHAVDIATKNRHSVVFRGILDFSVSFLPDYKHM